MATEIFLVDVQSTRGFSGQALVCGGCLVESVKYVPRDIPKEALQAAAQRLAYEMDAACVIKRTAQSPVGSWTWASLLGSMGIPVESTSGENVEVMRRMAGLPVNAQMRIPQEAYATISRLSAMYGKTMGGIVGALSYFEEAVDEHFGESGHGQALLERCIELMEEAESKRLEMGSQRKSLAPKMG
jgi:hypothetical protein